MLFIKNVFSGVSLSFHSNKANDDETSNSRQPSATLSQHIRYNLDVTPFHCPNPTGEASK